MSDYRSAVYQPQDELYVCSMGYEDRPELAHWGPGSRNYCILHYVTEGKGYFCGQEVRRGQGFYIHSGQQHEYHAHEASENPAGQKCGWNYFWMIFSEELAKKYVLPNIDINEHGIFEADFIGRLMMQRQRIFSTKRPMQLMEALSIFFSIMAMHEKQQPMDGSLPRSHIAGAKLLIENSFGKRLTVREIAEKLCIDDRYLYNLFRKYEGMSVKEYVDRRTIENACSLMASGGMSITDVAHTLGFDDVCTFSKFFKKRAGVSPAAYIRRRE